MISESGLDCLELSLEAKKELLLCLQEASSMDLPGGWEGIDKEIPGWDGFLGKQNARSRENGRRYV